ncbi:hypothetical protein D9M71_548560 [compost metagenome]
MPRTDGAHLLLEAPQRLATQAQRAHVILLAVGGGAGAIEYLVAGRLQQDDFVVQAQLGQAVDGPLLGEQALCLDLLGQEPVMVVGQVDQRIRALLVQQAGQAGGIPALRRRHGGDELDVLFRPQTQQRLSKGITAAQQHQAHAHGDGLPRCQNGISSSKLS